MASFTDNVQTELYKGGKDKQDMEMQMAPFVQMEANLVAAPLSLNILGQLCIVAASSPRDFPLKRGDKPFEYLRHPDSFVASLAQVSNEGHAAFYKAHTTLDHIMRASEQVRTKKF